MSRASLDAHGVLVVDKPPGPTSHDVVRVARRSFGPRVGHTGTLDPLATGVLPLVVGRATRLAQFMTGAGKTYEATVVFGRETDTYDAAGQTTADTGRGPDAGALAALVAALPGRLQQVPPVYSAKKIGGEPSHRLARRDAAVTPAAAEVEIHEAVLLAHDGLEARLWLRVSSGFYVRSLAYDLGRQLGTGAHLGGLRRLRAEPFGLEDAVSWERVVAGGPDLADAVVPPERLLTHLPVARLDGDAAAWARHGRQFSATVDWAPGGAGHRFVRLLDPEGRLAGIGTPAGDPAEPLAGGAVTMLLHPAVILG